jgi:hypothetical protein
MFKIVICSHCNGEGVVRIGKFVHRSEILHDVCPTCNGSGRMQQYSYLMEIPFSSDRDRIREADEKIVKEINLTLKKYKKDA